jgi:hypothetical protein
MAWSPAFIAALARTNGARLTMRKIPTFSILPGSSANIARSDIGAGVVAISTGSPLALSSQSLSVPSFSVSSANWRAALAGIDAGRWAVQSLPRGAACEVNAVLSSSATVAERIILGQSRDVSGIGSQSIVSGWGALSLCISRPQARVAPSTNDAALFSNCQSSGNALALSHPFNFSSHTTLRFASAPPFQRETGRPGAVLITPSSGSAYIVTYTGVSGNDLTGVSTSAEFDTSGSNASAGDVVQEVCWIDRHPVDMALRILVSTGTGGNGAYDTLPESWGLGIPEHLIDVAGFTAVSTQLNLALSSGTHIVHTVSTAPQGPALSWLQSELNRYGLWLCQRQGQISIRAALDRFRHRPTYALALDETNLLNALPERSNYDTAQTTESRFYTVRGEVLSDWGAIDEAPKTRPLLTSIQDGPIIDGWPNVYQNQVNINEAIAERVGPWHTRISTVINAQATLEAAQLCVGDWVTIKHRGLWDHGTSTTVLHPTRVAMVSSISCDWSSGTVSLRLHVQHPATVA